MNLLCHILCLLLPLLNLIVTIRCDVSFEFYRLTAAEWKSNNLQIPFLQGLSDASEAVCSSAPANCGGRKKLPSTAFRITSITPLSKNVKVVTSSNASDDVLTRVGLLGRMNISISVGGYLIVGIGDYVFSPPPPVLLNAIIIPLSLLLTAILLVATIVMSKRHAAIVHMELFERRGKSSQGSTGSSILMPKVKGANIESEMIGSINNDPEGASERLSTRLFMSSSSFKSPVSPLKKKEVGNVPSKVETPPFLVHRASDFAANNGFHNNNQVAPEIGMSQAELGRLSSQENFSDPLAINPVSRGGLLLAPIDTRSPLHGPMKKKKKRRQRKQMDEVDIEKDNEEHVSVAMALHTAQEVESDDDENSEYDEHDEKENPSV